MCVHGMCPRSLGWCVGEEQEEVVVDRGIVVAEGGREGVLEVEGRGRGRGRDVEVYGALVYASRLNTAFPLISFFSLCYLAQVMSRTVSTTVACQRPRLVKD